MNLFAPSPIDSSFWKDVASNPAAGPILKLIRDGLAEVPPRAPLPTASDYLAARRQNRRDIVDHHWQFDRGTFARLMAERLLSGSADDDRLLNWLFGLAFEPTWAVSAHLPRLDLPRSAAPTLDLASCEFAGELAELREAMLPWLKQQSGTLDLSIIDEIDRRVLTPFAQENRWNWADPNAEMINNWSGVCGGAILNACLSLEAQGFPRPAARRKAIEVLHLFWNRAFTATGECDEGPAYWNYGIAYGCLPLMRLTRDQIHADFDVQRILSVAGYLERIHIHNGYFLATNDSVSRVFAASWFAPWLAEFADSSFLRWWSSTYRKDTVRSVTSVLRHCWQMTRQPLQAPPTPPPVAARYLQDQQIAIFQRPSNGRPLFTFAIGGGHNAESHNHNDLGGLQVILDDVPWILDVGQPQYMTDFFSSKRYEKYIGASSAGHCCPAINGHEQRAGKEAAGIVLAADIDAGRLALDLTSAYPKEAGLQKWHREAIVPQDRPEARIGDVFELSQDGVFTHRLWFRERPTVQGQLITCGPLVVQLSDTPDAMRMEEFGAQDPRLLLREFPAGHRLYRVDMDYRAKAQHEREITTTIRLV